MSDRRTFLTSVAALLAAGAVPSSEALAVLDDQSHDAPDSFSLGGYTVRWLGWRELPVQLPLLGIWTATPGNWVMNITGLSEVEADAARERAMRMWVSCTHGFASENRAFDIFDTTYDAKRGMVIYPWSSENEKRTARMLALKNLIVGIKTGQPSGETL